MPTTMVATMAARRAPSSTAMRVAPAAGRTSCVVRRILSHSQKSSESVANPPARCSTTTVGFTSHQTVNAPRMPWKTTVASSTTAYTGLIGRSRR